MIFEFFQYIPLFQALAAPRDENFHYHPLPVTIIKYMDLRMM